MLEPGRLVGNGGPFTEHLLRVYLGLGEWGRATSKLSTSLLEGLEEMAFIEAAGHGVLQDLGQTEKGERDR
jgi:hypothetical protein